MFLCLIAFLHKLYYGTLAFHGSECTSVSTVDEVVEKWYGNPNSSTYGALKWCHANRLRTPRKFEFNFDPILIQIDIAVLNLNLRFSLDDAMNQKHVRGLLWPTLVHRLDAVTLTHHGRREVSRSDCKYSFHRAGWQPMNWTRPVGARPIPRAVIELIAWRFYGHKYSSARG